MDVTSSVPLSTTPGTRVTAVTTEDNDQNQLSQQELQQLQKLKTRDRIVRAHEAAHVAAGAGVVQGGASFSFQRGPDGIQYAIGGEVKINTSKVVDDPVATLQKAEQIRAAALAPAQPSAADQTIAAQAAKMAIEARSEINQQQYSQETSSDNKPASTSSELTGNFLDFTV